MIEPLGYGKSIKPQTEIVKRIYMYFGKYRSSKPKITPRNFQIMMARWISSSTIISNIIRRFCYNEFSRQYVQTVGADFHIKRFVLPARRDITLRITDVGGSELDGNMLDKYLYNSNIIVLIYDITNDKSFDCLSAWVDAIANALTCPPIIAVIGNKCDLEHQRSVNLQNVNQFAKDLNVLSYIVSAKTGESVTASIIDIVARYVGIPLTKAEKELQHPVVRAELIPVTPEIVKISNNKSHASMCRIQ